MVVRRIALALVVLGATAGLAACGVSKAIDPVAAAATKTEQAGGEKMAMTITITAAGRTSTITAEGAFDHQQGELTMDMSGLAQGSGITASALGAIKVLYLEESGDPVVYMQFPSLAGTLPSGKSWIRVDLQTAGRKLGLDFNQLMSQSSQNPAQALDLLRASGDVHEVGPATVDGVATTEYSGTVDLTRAAKLGGISDAAIQQLVDAGVPTDVPVEVWIGDDGFVRKLDLTEQLTAGGQSASVDLAVELSDYGTPVTVTAPPADEVLDTSALLGAVPTA